MSKVTRGFSETLGREQPTPEGTGMKSLLHNYGRRGVLLMLFAYVAFDIGLIVLQTTKSIDETDAVLYRRLPYEIRTGMWWCVASVAFVSAFRRKWQGWGWLALMIMPAERLLSHMWEAVTYMIGNGDQRLGTSLASVMTWSGVIVILAVTAGFDEDVSNPNDDGQLGGQQ